MMLLFFFFKESCGIEHSFFLIKMKKKKWKKYFYQLFPHKITLLLSKSEQLKW